MGIIDQIKLANAGRRMYAQMCNRCRQRLTQRFAKEVREQRQTGDYNTDVDVQAETMRILCPKCKVVYEEAMGNR